MKNSSTSHSESPAGYCFRRYDTIPRTDNIGVRKQERLRSHRPRHQTVAPETRQRRKMVPFHHGLRERHQLNSSVLYSSGIRRVAVGLARYCDLCAARTTVLSWAAQKRPRAKAEHNKATHCHRHSSSPLALTEPSGHRLRPSTAHWS